MTELIVFDSGLPAPDEATPADLVAACTQLAERVDEIDDLAFAVELLPKVAAIETYLVAAGRDKDPAQTAARLLEGRIGELLGPGEQGKRTDLEPITDRQQVLDRPRASEFRLMAQWKDRWRKQLPASRDEILRLCRRFKVEHTPARGGQMEDVETDRVRLLHGDFRDRLTDLPAGSVDLILTDPPYPTDELDVWSDLAKEAARLLGPRGRLAAYSGQLNLPRVIDALCEHLTYGWTYCLLLDAGSHSRIMGRHVMQTWKPVLVFTTGTWPSGEWHTDLIVSPAQAKDRYRWQQHVDPAVELIDRLCPPEGLVIDPMMGVGTFAKAADFAGRRFIGVELDSGRFEKAQRLLDETEMAG